jgi:hypothetical protein
MTIALHRCDAMLPVASRFERSRVLIENLSTQIRQQGREIRCWPVTPGRGRWPSWLGIDPVPPLAIGSVWVFELVFSLETSTLAR